MDNFQLALIVTLLAIGSSILVGYLGYLIDKNAEPTQRQDGRDGK